MDQTITIVPVNKEMQRRIDAVRILNEFVGIGFIDRKAFVTVVMEFHPQLSTYEGGNKLNNFWALREFSINEILEGVLETLRNS